MGIVGITRQSTPDLDRLGTAPKDSNTIPAFLAMPDRTVPGFADGSFREPVLRSLQLLQAHNVRFGLSQPAQQNRQPTVNAIDVECTYFQTNFIMFSHHQAWGLPISCPTMVLNPLSSNLRLASMLCCLLFCFIASSLAAAENLEILVNAASSFSATLVQQLQMIADDPSPHEFAEKTVDYAEAKAAYFEALRSAMAELRQVARQQRSQQLDAFAAAFSLSGEQQQKFADEKTAALFKRFKPDPSIEDAQNRFIRAKKLELKFHKDFNGLNSVQ
jgi:hypothetical protein